MPEESGLQPGRCCIKEGFAISFEDHAQTGKLKLMSLAECRIIDLPKISDPRGNLTFIEGGRHVPFEIKRVYYLYDVPGGAERGGHAHKGLHQLIIAMSGSFDVILNDGKQKNDFI